MQQFNMFYLLKDLRKLSCKDNRFQRLLPFIIIVVIVYFHSNNLLFIFIIIIIFKYFKQNLAE